MLGKINADESEKVRKLYKIEGYPTLKWFQNGKPEPYTSNLEVNDIVKFVTKKAGGVNYTKIACDDLERTVGKK